MTEARWMSIGEFARAARLTVKALRYYDREGLLTPDRVDPGTGYRFYAPTQLAAALRIGLLRRADVSVAAIRAFLSDPAQGSEVLAAERARIERDAARAARSFALVDSLGNAVDADLPVAVHHIDAATVLWRESCAVAETLDEAASEAIGTLLAQARRCGLDESASVVGRYPAALDGEVSFGVGLEIGAGARLDEAVEAQTVTLPGGVFAGVDFTGAPALLPVAYHVLFARLADDGVPVEGPVREYYLADPAVVGEDEMRTRVVHPVPEDYRPGWARS
ncbi:MerR family transcriptional regulator [Rhodococcus sp. DT1]|uniref:MerR family transcriptional regulator n=1 Tax=Rhodococcus sp. DT1 TaxID=3416544 RepID=UPI003CFA80E0